MLHLHAAQALSLGENKKNKYMQTALDFLIL